MKSLVGCRRGWTYCAVLLALTIALIVRETSSHPAAVGTVPRRSHGSLSTRSGSSSHQQHKQPRRVARPIERPEGCREDIIFTDCFLCGKVAESYVIYQRCCQRLSETVDFCNRLLT